MPLAVELAGEQMAFIEKANPAFNERHVESSQPGELLCQDTFNSFAFGFLHTSKFPEAAVAVLHNEVFFLLPTKNIKITAMLTDNGREFCGTSTHPYDTKL
ncbi:MAG: hypothetical protein JRI57_07515 [Deltaproteobacteria bacterium]|nr:hypothetical protein [Deltaproteobacteria bacterium]MBW1952299.1 hypothetical protein [Deltaproteobacteria bacterium]